MQDHEFELLQVKASIAPQAETWPKPDFSKVSISGTYLISRSATPIGARCKTRSTRHDIIR